MLFRHTLARLALRVRDDETGASLVEYALLIALIAVVCVAAVTLLGGSVQQPYSELSSAI